MTLLHWQIQSGGVRAFNCHRRTWLPGTGFQAHGHDYCELFWVEDGILEHHWQGERSRLAAGDLVAIVPGEEHALAADRTGSARIVNLSLSLADAEALRQHLADDVHIWPWEGTRQQRHHHLTAKAREALRLLVDLVDQHLPSSRELLILGVMHGLARGRSLGLAGLPPDLRAGILGALESDPTLSVVGLARRLRRSREGLTRSCRRLVGRPLADLIRDWRLERAGDLLKGSDQGIDAIALAVGFQATGGFYKAFQRRYGMAPGRWRSQ